MMNDLKTLPGHRLAIRLMLQAAMSDAPKKLTDTIKMLAHVVEQEHKFVDKVMAELVGRVENAERIQELQDSNIRILKELIDRWKRIAAYHGAEMSDYEADDDDVRH